MTRLRGAAVLADHAAEDFPVLHRRLQLHDDRFVVIRGPQMIPATPLLPQRKPSSQPEAEFPGGTVRTTISCPAGTPGEPRSSRAGDTHLYPDTLEDGVVARYLSVGPDYARSVHPCLGTVTVHPGKIVTDEAMLASREFVWRLPVFLVAASERGSAKAVSEVQATADEYFLQGPRIDIECNKGLSGMIERRIALVDDRADMSLPVVL